MTAPHPTRCTCNADDRRPEVNNGSIIVWCRACNKIIGFLTGPMNAAAEVDHFKVAS